MNVSTGLDPAPLGIAGRLPQTTPDAIAAAIAAIAEIDAVPAILDIVCRTTGMGFAAIARVTKDRWVACEVNDRIGFGLEAGGELVVETTICSAIRRSGEAVVIDEVRRSPA